MNVGIFWVFDGRVIGRFTPLSMAEESISGLLDSPQNHVDAWPQVRVELPQILREVEYFEVPRGRVLYSKTKKQAIVYMDATLHQSEIKSQICHFFGLNSNKVNWRRDDHYTTDSADLDKLFGSD